ncbi:hypothetical protein CC85DRAFT_22688 [Cutaneotrichosporon oleaginosum]|uniref:RRM domain-containing protein n=1 Tax=Cutaneotrichosporon oleaginosum TaxID=879819 RepID=A0A0J0XSY3_9TREE|nr:uncharacterized protein CC85DRAFT_22688 [Cutaneotrichosporon oleaginosum]KLT44180.1 hypothetical protein CC85DRAFT_22688 [Cutaneotrichosporon oleaginosum]TXT11650.1 hypothetical protein COLE_02060 [Cutaneotrichosporon oleaginosum]
MSEKFRTDFERFGELREFFDSISRRGLAFVTYYDIRGAEAARREMHGTKIYGRAIDVHFGLPKEHDREGPCDQSKNQGTLLARIHPPRPLHPDEVGPVAEQSGAIKTIRDGRVPSEVMIEFYDSRAAVDFHARFANKPFGGGTLELDYMWDEGEIVNPDPVRADEVISSTFVTRRELLDREGRGHKYPQVPDQYDNKRGQSPPRRYGGGGRYNDAPTHAMRPPVQDPHRLEEARKVQNLLATLGSVPSLGSGAPPNPQGPPPPGPGYGGPPPPPGPPPDPRRSSYSGPPSGPPPGPPPRPPPMRYPPGPPPPSYSSAPPPSHSPSYPPPSSSYPLSNYPPAPPPASYPPQHSPPAPAPSYAPPYSPVASSTPLPSQVLAMLQPQQSGQQGYQSSPPAQSYDQRQAYNASPPQQGYQSTPGYGGAPDYRPPRPQPGYNSQPPQQQQGYDPKTGSDVSSLLAMLNR